MNAPLKSPSDPCLLNWSLVDKALEQSGWSLLPNLLCTETCDGIVGLLSGDGFRSQVIMARHGYGQGEYRYFSYPLPTDVQRLRTGLYPHLASIANRWQTRLGLDAEFPADHEGFLDRCRQKGQTRPTPLLLTYGPGDYNRLHQDLYGEVVFPLQLAVLLDDPATDFEGGEFVLTEQRARMQTKVTVVPLRKGDGVIFAVNHRPIETSRGASRAVMRHGVSPVRLGRRRTLGVIFHDAA